MTQNLNGMSKVAKNIAPQFPLYIPSKGRHEFMITSKALTAMKVMHYVIAEPDEVDLYQKAIKQPETLRGITAYQTALIGTG